MIARRSGFNVSRQIPGPVGPFRAGSVRLSRSRPPIQDRSAETGGAGRSTAAAVMAAMPACLNKAACCCPPPRAAGLDGPAISCRRSQRPGSADSSEQRHRSGAGKRG
jgi:hypothetical protein